MKVTTKDLAFEIKLVEKLDLLIHRCHKLHLDVCLLIDGYEGYGKSNMAAGVCYYVAEKTGRAFTVDNVFFDAEEMIKFALKTEKQIIWWDEAAFMGLSSDYQNKIQATLLKLLMVGRKKNHFYIFNIPRFYRLREPIIERAIGLIHVYARNETDLGRFAYFRKKALEYLHQDFKKKKRMPAYKQFYTFHGTFPKALAKVIDEDEYEKKKDAAMMDLAKTLEKGKSKKDEALEELKGKIGQIDSIKRDDLAEELGISSRTLFDWRKKYTKKRKDSSNDKK